MNKQDQKQLQDLAKQRFNELKQKRDEKLIPNMDKFNKSFDEIFK